MRYLTEIHLSSGDKCCNYMGASLSCVIKSYHNFIRKILTLEALCGIIIAKVVRIMINIMPESKLRNEFSKVEEIVKKGEPVFLTKNGYGSMVVLSMEKYAELTGEVTDINSKKTTPEEESMVVQVIRDSGKGKTT